MKKLLLKLLMAILVCSGAMATPTLNSYPTAAATIYLDFDGHDVSNSIWNFGTPFNCTPAMMSDDQITEAFNRVSEDFRPFNINITTELAKFLAAPIDQRMRVVITPTSAWYPSAPGVSYLTSFVWGDDTPCFVFSDRLTNNPRKIAEAISHESGHTMGLNHQAEFAPTCTLVSSYNTGTGTGVTSWGPIMGSVSTRTLTQWNFGPTASGCSNKQDNLSIITTNNGFGYRPDDVSDLYTNSFVVNVADNIIEQSGVITTSSDRDIFRFDLTQRGTFILNVEPYSIGKNYSGANLDIKIELQDSKGTIIRIYDVEDSLNIHIDTTLNSGTYYVIVDGTGNLNTENDYGSLGSYTMKGNYSGVTNISTLPSNSYAIQNILSGTKIREGNKINWMNGIAKPGEAITVLYSIEEGEFKELARPDINTTSYIHGIKSPGVYAYKLKIIEKNGSIRFTNTIKIEATETTGIFKVIKQAQHPVIVNATEPYDYKVVDINGRVIQIGKASAGTKLIDIRNYPTGIYNLNLVTQHEERVERFMNK
jgi:hypothetical protein